MAAPMKMKKLLFLTIIGAFVTHVFCKPKPVTLTLDAKWRSTPLLLEASEYIAKESEESFWRFVEDVNKLRPEQITSETDQSYYHLILKYAAKLLSTMDLNLFKLSLSLRLYSPAIEMYRQLALEENTDCDAFINIHGQRSCDPKDISKLVDEAKNRSIPPVFKFDHTYPGSDGADVVVIIYAEIGTAGFQKFHNELKVLASNKQIRYILRHFVQTPSERKTRLSGYGVELNIKSTEYKAKDDTKLEDEDVKDHDDMEDADEDTQGFMFSTLKNLHPELKDDLKRFKSHLIDGSSELAPLKVWQLQDLSLQAAQRIVSAPQEDSLKLLRDISQNFPSLARTLVKTHVNDEFKKELSKNQQYFEQYHAMTAGDSALYLNGLHIDLDVYDIYTMLEVMRNEAKLMEGLFSLGFKGSETKQLLKLDVTESKDYALDLRHTAIKFINDLENDKKYKNWPSSVQEMLRPTFPGMLRHVAKNFFHLVFIVDPFEENSRELLKMAEAFYVHSAPIRIAVVMVVNFDSDVTGEEDAGVALSRAYDCIRQEEDPPKALSFITDIYERAGGKEITVQMIKSEFKKSYPDEDMEKVFGDHPDYDTLRLGAADYISKSGLSDFPQVMLNGISLKKESLNEHGFEEAVVGGILDQTTAIQKAVYHGKLHDFVNTLEWLMEQDHVLPRLNSRILSPPTKSLDFTTNIVGNIFNEPETFKLMGSKDMSSIMVENMKYISRKDESMQGVTLWIVCDLETVKGRELMYNAMKTLKHSHHMRMGIIYNPSLEAGHDFFISKAVHTAFQTLSNNLAKLFITKLVKDEYVWELKAGTKTLDDLEVNGMDMKEYKEALEKQTTDFIKVHRAFVENALGWDKEARGVIANGKVLGPFNEDESFLQEDLDLLEKRVFQQGGKQISEELIKLGINGKRGSDLVMTISSLLTAGKSSSTERKQIQYAGDQHSVIHIPADTDSPAYTVEAVLDPLSQDAQKLSAILVALNEVFNMDIKIFMNSRDKLSEMPLKLFYRYVLDPEITFKVDGSFSTGPYAKFLDLPQKSLLTLAMKPPESWLVEAVKAPYDLDNILLEEVESGITAEFDLEYLLLEGHCSDSSTGQPPRGLQFTLGTNSSKPMVDTIVMANLGYFQLKANPGAWLLRLRDGRSKDLYDISSHEFTDTPPGSEDVIVVMNSFNSKIVRVKVAKKTDHLNEELLKDDDDDKSLWDSISSTISGDKKEEDPDKTLNIFSVASGHMYERLMRIMMLSVLKHTKSHVKFWFLKNYLSPSFKDFIPKMAKEYGFEYELVQYKWPRWLNQQQEKQRIMWGYKILFLDVLFPLDVKKFIFVDADQIVRTDLQELHDLDLGGAPYGYTPFCESRKEMDGFRFWKSGYWASHLGHRKYHISALYVVDLKKFRRIAAGDRLRGQYQGLSQDPNSLSNLDQDLPNNMIHQVKIKSLPQDWLWCETWCNDASKATAKTIDLCNNPQTKEPKLKAALRIAPEWKEYDYEVKVLWDKVYGTNTRSQIEYEPPKIDVDKIGSRLKDEL